MNFLPIPANFLLGFLLVLGFISPRLSEAAKSFEGADEYLIGKHEREDESLLVETFDLSKSNCGLFRGHPCENTPSHFTLDFKKSSSCISAIKVYSFPTENSKGTKAIVYCRKGGIGTDHCLLEVKKNGKRSDTKVEIYGTKSPHCAMKDRYVGNNPKAQDAYGIQYRFDKDGWSVQRSETALINGPNGNTYYHKNGLFNMQLTYLAKDDKYSVAKETFPNGKTKFSVHLSNYNQYRISFLDIYWFQESGTHHPKLPSIRYNGHCEKKNQTCEVVFDCKEPITYAVVKVFSNINYTGPRTRGPKG